MSDLGYAYEPHRVTKLPGWNGELPFNMFAGYLNGSDTSRLFYIYVESDEIDPREAPITAWFNGGPGCSSLDGFWYEHGPFLLDRKGNLSLRPYRWNRLSNMLFLEAPVGVGMSYSIDNNYTNNDDKTAIENRNALQNFFHLYPALKNHRFFLTGESYAGIYVPTLAEAILDAESTHHWSGPPLIGIGVGNGCTGTESGICGYYFGSHCAGLYYEYQFLSGFSFINNDLKEKIDKMCEWDLCINHSTNVTLTNSDIIPLSHLCIAALDEAMKLLGLINIYNVIGSCTFNSCDGPAGNEPVGRVGKKSNTAKISNVARTLLSSSPYSARKLPVLGSESSVPLEFDDSVAQITDTGPAECIDSVDASNYMNREDVQQALHARAPGYCWAVCNHHKGWAYTSTRKNLPKDLYPRLVSKLRVVIYNGDMDACVPYTDNEAWTSNMNFPVKKHWHPWSYNSGNMTGEQVAGYAIEYDVSHLGKGSFEFKTVRGAGHMVPSDMPEPALELFRRLIEIPVRNISYADIVPTPITITSSCGPTQSTSSSISPQVGLALIMLVMILFGTVVFLYQEVRVLRLRILNWNASTSSGHNIGDDDINLDNQIDVSERDSTVHADDSSHEIELMKGKTNSSLLDHPSDTPGRL